MDNQTLNYYNANARDFVQGTVGVDFHITQDRFLAQLEKGASILDFGCGSGRDTKYFLERGFAVEATDGSAELCKLASEPFPIWWTRKSEKKLNEFLSILRPVQAATDSQRRASKRSGGIQPRAECGRTVL